MQSPAHLRYMSSTFSRSTSAFQSSWSMCWHNQKSAQFGLELIKTDFDCLACHRLLLLRLRLKSLKVNMSFEAPLYSRSCQSVAVGSAR